MALVQTKDPRVVRDTNTQALLATNADELLRHRRMRSTLKKVTTQQRTVDERFDALNGRIDRCEALLQELVQHVSTLVAKYPVIFSERE